MNVTINTDLIKTLGITHAVFLAVCQAAPDLTPRLIAQMLGRDYSRTTAIIRDLRERGYLPKRNATAARINVIKMNVTINTDLIKTMGITPAVVLAICQAAPVLTPRLIAQMLGRDYSRTTAIIRDLRERGYLPKRNATAARINVIKK